MGNKLCGTVRKRKRSNKDEEHGYNSDRVSDEDQKEVTSMKEDVTYVTLDHGNSKATGVIRHREEDDCDYATVKVLSETCQEEGTDDYVLMG